MRSVLLLLTAALVASCSTSSATPAPARPSPSETDYPLLPLEWKAGGRECAVLPHRKALDLIGPVEYGGTLVMTGNESLCSFEAESDGGSPYLRIFIKRGPDDYIAFTASGRAVSVPGITRGTTLYDGVSHLDWSDGEHRVNVGIASLQPASTPDPRLNTLLVTVLDEAGLEH